MLYTETTIFQRWLNKIENCKTWSNLQNPNFNCAKCWKLCTTTKSQLPLLLRALHFLTFQWSMENEIPRPNCQKLFLKNCITFWVKALVVCHSAGYRTTLLPTPTLLRGWLLGKVVELRAWQRWRRWAETPSVERRPYHHHFSKQRLRRCWKLFVPTWGHPTTYCDGWTS